MLGTLIGTVTVGAGGAAFVDFTSIPQTGTDLVLLSSVRTAYAGNGDTAYVTLNGDTTAANYTYIRLLGNGSAASSATGNTYFFAGYTSAANDTANTFGSGQLTIPNYTGSTVKVGSTESVGENNGTQAYSAIHAVKWTGTAAITSMRIQAASATNLAQYTVFSLYSVTKGSGGATAA